MENLTGKIENMDADLAGFLRNAGKIASLNNWDLYLVGGAARDLFLQRTIFDIDLVTNGDPLELAQKLAGGNKITRNSAFFTVKFTWQKWSVDIAAARTEVYRRPGALPEVLPTQSISVDLIRRDFTVNALAVILNPEKFWEVIDPANGLSDIKSKIIRIIHDNSFADDATRIWRAVRYEQRLGFNIEPHTLKLIKSHISFLNTVSYDRIRRELELVLAEDEPEHILHRAANLKVTDAISPNLIIDSWLTETFRRGRKCYFEPFESAPFYWAILAYRMNYSEVDSLASKLRLKKSLSQLLFQAIEIRDKLQLLRDQNTTPDRVYYLLNGYLPEAVMINYLVSEDNMLKQKLRMYLLRWRKVKVLLNGNDMVKLGMEPGPLIKQIRNEILAARLAGTVHTRRDELVLLQKWQQNNHFS